MKVPFLRTAYNYSMDDVSRETSLRCDDDSLAIQSARDECDINTIVRRFGLTGELPSDVAVPQSGDFVGATDFHASMNVVRKAQEEFMRLPADMRYRFHNDPGEFISFFEDSANRDEAVKLGLVVSRETVPVSVVAPTVTP